MLTSRLQTPGNASALLLAVFLGQAETSAQQAATVEQSASLDRVARELKRTPALDLTPEGHRAVPVATFRVVVEQRQFMLTFEEQLRKEFQLTALQRQSQEWFSRCCGINEVELLKSLDRALRRREVRRIRKQIDQDLAQIAANKARKR
jgi:hypothetical protein